MPNDDFGDRGFGGNAIASNVVGRVTRKNFYEGVTGGSALPSKRGRLVTSNLLSTTNDNDYSGAEIEPSFYGDYPTGYVAVYERSDNASDWNGSVNWKRSSPIFTQFGNYNLLGARKESSIRFGNNARKYNYDQAAAGAVYEASFTTSKPFTSDQGIKIRGLGTHEIPYDTYQTDQVQTNPNYRFDTIPLSKIFPKYFNNISSSINWSERISNSNSSYSYAYQYLYNKDAGGTSRRSYANALYKEDLHNLGLAMELEFNFLQTEKD